MRWVKDHKLEGMLRENGIVFDTQRVPYSKIDVEEGYRHQVRMIGKIDQNAVLAMALSMEKDTAAFPMPLLQTPRHGTVFQISGSHRISAHLLQDPIPTEIEAYTICISDKMLLDLTGIRCNLIESPLGYGREERVMQARRLIKEYSLTVNDAAKECGIKPEWIYKANASQEAKKLLADIPGAEQLSKTTLEKLHAIPSTDSLRATAKLFLEYTPEYRELLHIIEDVKSVNTEKDQRIILDKWESVLRTRKFPKTASKKTTSKKVEKPQPGTVRFNRLVRDQYLRNLTGLLMTSQRCTTIEQLQLDASDLEQERKFWNAITKWHDQVFANRSGSNGRAS
jgi:hypothetical protein